MTCGKCYSEWCWICGSRMTGAHFAKWNLFGCPGSQFSNQGKCLSILLKVGLILFTPIIIFFWILGVTVYSFQMVASYCSKGSCLLFLILNLLIALPLGLGFGAAGGAICVGIFALPAMLVQTYRLIMIMLKGVDVFCCFRCLPCCR
jgi:hypothetical protein